MNLTERWRPVVGFEGFYEVSDAGRIRSIERTGVYAGRWMPTRMTFPARVMKQSKTPAGYRYLALRTPNTKSVKHLVHRLVMAAFVGQPPKHQPQVNHIDGDKSNNALSNLEYCSGSENLLHLTRVLKRKIGGAGAHSKLTEDQAIAVVLDGRTLKEIGRDYGISLQAVWYIKKGKNWPHVQAKARELEKQLKHS